MEYSKTPAGPVLILKGILRPHAAELFFAGFCFILKQSPIWLMPVIFADIIDVISKKDIHSAAALGNQAILVAVMLAINLPAAFFYTRSLSKVTRTIESELRTSLCRRLQCLSVGYYSKQGSGKLQTKIIQDVGSIIQLLSGFFEIGLSCLLNIIFALSITGIRHPWFLAVFVVTVLVAVGIVRVIRSPLESSNAKLRFENERMSDRINEMIQLIPITRAHGLEHEALSRVEASIEGLRVEGLQIDRKHSILIALTWIGGTALTMMCLIGSAWACLQGWNAFSVGDVVLFSTYFSLISGSIFGLINMAPSIMRGLESVRSIQELLDNKDDEANQGQKAMKAVDGDIRFENVNYYYPGSSKAAVHNFSISVHSGETIALVGHSGAGKSTLLRLLSGFMRPTSGRILIDGHVLEGYDLRTYRRFLGVVPQEPILFDGTILENVAHGLPSVSIESVIRALHSANAWEFVSQLPQGLDTCVGINGAMLSVGQKQRLTIARAIVRNPKILFLDEATSSLDTETEFVIQNELKNIMKDRTCFIIAHRLSTVRHATRIIVLEDGGIIEIGSHDVLLSSGGRYAEIYSKQMA